MNRTRLVTSGTENINCSQRDTKGKRKGFAFLCIRQDGEKVEEIEFGILDEGSMKHVINVINIQELMLAKYYLMINFHEI